MSSLVWARPSTDSQDFRGGSLISSSLDANSICTPMLLSQACAPSATRSNYDGKARVSNRIGPRGCTSAGRYLRRQTTVPKSFWASSEQVSVPTSYVGHFCWNAAFYQIFR